MSYLTDPDPAETREGWAGSEAAEYLRERYHAFMALSPRIIDLQHRAAVAAGRAREQGQDELHRAGVEVIRTLGNLNQLHHRTVERINSVRSYLGLGAVQVPVALLTVFSGLAALVAWVFRRYEIQERLVDGLEAGTLTRDDLDALDAQGPAPTEALAGLGSKVALWIVLLGITVAGFQWLGQRWNDNPDLVVWDRNPPEPEGELLGRAEDIRYWHAENGEPYIHEFGRRVGIYLMPDGDVRLHRPGRRLWADFP